MRIACRACLLNRTADQIQRGREAYARLRDVVWCSVLARRAYFRRRYPQRRRSVISRRQRPVPGRP